MPADVHDRLRAALARTADQAATTDSAGPVPAQPLGWRHPAGVTRPEQVRSTRTGPGRRQRRWTRLAGPAALVTVSLAVVGLGLGLQRQTGSSDEATSTATWPNRRRGIPHGRAPQRTGLDYTAEALASPPTAPARARQRGPN